MATATYQRPISTLADRTRPDTEEEASMESMRTMLKAMTWASQAKDAALQDLERRLNAALQEAEQGRAREDVLLRRAERSEEAEEALASQMAEVEAEAFSLITEANKRLASASGPLEAAFTTQTSIQIAEQQRRVQAAEEESAALARRCYLLEEEVKQGRAREVGLQRRATIAEEAEAALASQIAEVEAEVFMRITESSKLLTEREAIVAENTQVAEVWEALARAEEALVEVQAKLREAEAKNHGLERRLAELQTAGGEKSVIVRGRKHRGWGGGREGLAEEEVLFFVAPQVVATYVKLNLWNPSCVKLVSSSS